MSDDHDDLLGGERPISALAAPRPREATRRRHPSRGRYRLRRAIALFVLVLVGFGLWFAAELYEPFTGGGTGRVTVEIRPHESARQVGNELQSQGVVSSGFFFDLRAMIDGDRSKLHSGTFTLRHAMSYAAALKVLTAPSPAPTVVRVTIPEGFTRAQIAALARSKGLRGDYLVDSRPADARLNPRSYGATSAVHTLEGFLFPDTYFATKGEPASRLVSDQIAAFHQNFDQLDFAHSRAAGLTRYEVLIIASIIEREAQVPTDRRLVAAVIYNRLHAGMKLGVDATLRYRLNDWTRPLTESQLALNSAYNTDLRTGLPPTPISNPGLASMVAAANPANVSYLYYVNKPNTCGKLAFATTVAAWQADVNAYNAARAANGGRAPTRCP